MDTFPPPRHKQSLDFPNAFWEVLLTLCNALLMSGEVLSAVTDAGPYSAGDGCPSGDRSTGRPGCGGVTSAFLLQRSGEK